MTGTPIFEMLFTADTENDRFFTNITTVMNKIKRNESCILNF